MINWADGLEVKDGHFGTISIVETCFTIDAGDINWPGVEYRGYTGYERETWRWQHRVDPLIYALMTHASISG
jgi:hypothetical protein